MMEYRICAITSQQALSFRQFMLPSVAASLEYPDYAFYLAISDKTPLGLLVADPKKADPEILSIGVAPEYTRQGIGTALINYAVGDLLSLYDQEELEEPNRFLASFPVSGEAEGAVSKVLQKAGFELSESGSFYEVTALQLKNCESLNLPAVKEKTKERLDKGNIVSLKEVPGKALKEFSYTLSEMEDQVPGIDPSALEEEVSYFAMDPEGEHISSCILFAKEEKGVLSNTFVYQSPRNDLSKSELIYLLAASSETILRKYGNQVTLSFLTVNEISEKLIRKLFPEAKEDGKYMVFELDFDEAFRILGEERFHSDLAFDQFSLENMACRDCKHCQKDSILECGKYLQKPDGVLNGGECPLFENRG